MAGIRIKAEFDDRAITDRLNELAARVKNMRPVFTELGEHLIESTEDRFKDQTDPAGNPWAPLDRKYRRRKKKHADLILVLDQYLSGGLAYQASTTQLEWGSDRIYAATHQFGDDTRNIPARPFLGISATDESEIIAILEDYLSG